jgi:Arc/MetJ-type ribon-helix-helix transcriptional regulator
MRRSRSKSRHLNRRPDPQVQRAGHGTEPKPAPCQFLVLSVYYNWEEPVRTISVRLDDASEARLDSLCQALGVSQTEVVKAGLELLQRQSASPAALAERLGLIGSFSSGEPGTGPTSHGRNHSAVLRQKLGRQQQQQRRIAPEA